MLSSHVDGTREGRTRNGIERKIIPISINLVDNIFNNLQSALRAVSECFKCIGFKPFDKYFNTVEWLYGVGKRVMEKCLLVHIFTVSAFVPLSLSSGPCEFVLHTCVGNIITYTS